MLNPFEGLSQLFTYHVIFLPFLSLSRYIAVCYPLKYKSFTAHCTPVVRAMYYIAPAVFFAVVLSLPKFLEVEVSLERSHTLTRYPRSFALYPSRLRRMMLTFSSTMSFYPPPLRVLLI